MSFLFISPAWAILMVFVMFVIALVMALWASEATWSLYTGVLSYLLMALLFGVEYLFRLRFMRLHQGGV